MTVLRLVNSIRTSTRSRYARLDAIAAVHIYCLGRPLLWSIIRPSGFRESVLQSYVDRTDRLCYRPTPFDVSKYPGAGSFRICNLVHGIAHDSSSQKSIAFTHMNTHLDDQSDDQRRYGASLILYRARYEAWKSGGPVIVTGDFNSGSTGADAGAYEIITGLIPPVSINETFAARYAVPQGTLDGFVMDDMKGVADRINVFGDYATYTGFDGNTSVWTRIDFVLGASSGDWSVLRSLPKLLSADDLGTGLLTPTRFRLPSPMTVCLLATIVLHSPISRSTKYAGSDSG